MRLVSEAASRRDFSDTELLCTRALADHPSAHTFRLTRALAIATLGRQQEAIGELRYYLSHDSNSSSALNWLSMLLRESGDSEGAISASVQAMRLTPHNPDTAYNLGMALLAGARLQEAISWLDHATRLLPEFGAAWYALGCAYEAVGQPWQALRSVRRQVQLDPHPEGFLKLAQLELSLGHLSQAHELAQRAVAKPQVSPEALIVIGESLNETDPQSSSDAFRAAFSQRPDLEQQVLNDRAKRLARSGRIDEAQQLNEQMIRSNPRSGQPYLNYVTLKKVTGEDMSIIESMGSLLAGPSLPAQDRVALHYALGKSFDNLGDFDTAWIHYTEANAVNRDLHVQTKNFDRDKFARHVDSLIAAFGHSTFKRRRTKGNRSDKPIFIVGMMRTGTTLVEQILACHSSVTAAGELAHWAYAEPRLIDPRTKTINLGELHAQTEEYMDLLDFINAEAPKITDKNPANCLYAGLIALAFPNAKIVYMDRDPLETALSIFITPTRYPPEFGCDPENIVFAVRQTNRIMKHWLSVIPNSQIKRFTYESVVNSPGETIREIVSHCGLEWQDECLHPEASRSMVGTPSVWQVRQPLYRTSIKRSDRYAPWLGAFERLRQI